MDPITLTYMPVPRDLADALIEVVKERMEGMEMSINRLAGLIGANSPTLNRQLRSHGNLTVDEWEALAGALGESLNDLLDAARRRM